MSLNSPHRRNVFYLLPNAFTTANLFAGFYSILAALNGHFESAAIAVFAAMLFDGMDGRVARITKTESEFGEQYDSMSDMLSFGVAPAVLVYSYSLDSLGRLGWFAAFIYAAGAAIRLARFNTNINIVDSRFFQGLPSPSAAALLAGFVWLSVDNRLPIHNVHNWVGFVLAVYAGLSMISNAPFYSGKSLLKENKRFPGWLMFVLVIGFAMLMLNASIAITVLFLAYALSGWVLYYLRLRRARKLGKKYKTSTYFAAQSENKDTVTELDTKSDSSVESGNPASKPDSTRDDL